VVGERHQPERDGLREGLGFPSEGVIKKRMTFGQRIGGAQRDHRRGFDQFALMDRLDGDDTTALAEQVDDTDGGMPGKVEGLSHGRFAGAQWPLDDPHPAIRA